MSIQSLRDRNQTIYIGLYNTCNSFCYYISAIQRLHSSTTLNQRLLSLELDDSQTKTLNDYNTQQSSIEPVSVKPNLLDLIISPLFYYSKLTNLNQTNYNQFKETHELIKNKIEELISYFDVSMLNGGNPDDVLVTFLIPVLYLKFNDLSLIKQIIREINFNPSRLAKLLYSYNNRYNFKVLRDNELNNRIESSYKDLVKQLDVNNLYKDYSIQFNISTIAIYLQDVNGNDSKYAGHAINLVYGYFKFLGTDFNETNNEFQLDLYVIDDSIMIIPLKTYVQTHIDRIKYFEIQDATDEVLQLISKYCEINKRLHRDVIKPIESKLQLESQSKFQFNKSSLVDKPNPISLVGGDSTSDNSQTSTKPLTQDYQIKNNIVGYILLLIILLIIIVAILVVYLTKHDLLNIYTNNQSN